MARAWLLRALADEVDEVGEPPLFGRQLRLLKLERVWEVRAKLGDFLLYAAEDVRDVLRIGQLVLTASRMTFSASVRRTSVLLSHAPLVAARQP